MSFSVTKNNDEFNVINQRNSTNQNTSTVDVGVTFGEMVASEIISNNFNEDVVEDNSIVENVAVNTTNSSYGISTDDYMMARNISNNADVSNISSNYIEEIEEVASIEDVTESKYTSDILTDDEITYALDNLLYGSHCYYGSKYFDTDEASIISIIEQAKTVYSLSDEEVYNYIDILREETIMWDSILFDGFDKDFQQGDVSLSELDADAINYLKEQYNNGDFETKEDFDAFIRDLVDYGIISEDTADVINYDAVTISELNETLAKYNENTPETYNLRQLVIVNDGVEQQGFVDGYYDYNLDRFIQYPQDLVINYSDNDWNGNGNHWLDFLYNKYNDLDNYLDENNYNTHESQKGLDCIEELKNILNELNNIGAKYESFNK